MKSFAPARTFAKAKERLRHSKAQVSKRRGLRLAVAKIPFAEAKDGKLQFLSPLFAYFPNAINICSSHLLTI